MATSLPPRLDGTDPTPERPAEASPAARFAPPAKRSLGEALRCARETTDLRIGPGVLREVPALFEQHFPGHHAVLITDRACLFAAGAAVQDHLALHGVPMQEAVIFSEMDLPAEHSYVERLESILRSHDAIPVAVGSGTINDLVKLASHRTDRPYFCVATAASMDGYTAFGASITFEGAKQTFDCPAPRVVLADIDVIRHAPPAMTAAGYADLLAKTTAGADWILADALGVEPIDPNAWALVQGGLRDAVAHPAGAREGDPAALLPLVEGLMLGGFAMQWLKSSRPASGAEHQFSHLWDMECHMHDGRSPPHGFKVGVATLLVTALYEELLRRLGRADMSRACADWPEPDEAARRVRTLFAADDFVETAVRETIAKHVSREELKEQLATLRAAWPELQERLRDQLLPLAEVRRWLHEAGAPTGPEQIGLTRVRLRQSFLRAHHIRRRFTVLDLAVRTGCLDECLDQLFGPGGPWDIAADPMTAS